MVSGIPESNENQNSAFGPLPTGCSLQTLPETRLGCKVEGRMGSPHPQEDKMGAGIGACLGARDRVGCHLSRVSGYVTQEGDS